MRATQRGNAALSLHLAKATIRGGNDDIAGKHHLDADGVDDALYRRDDRLAAPAAERKRVDIARLALGLFRLRTEEFWHIETGSEIAALGAHHADPVVVCPVQQRNGIRDIRHHLRAERILFRRVVDDDLQYPSVHFGANLSYLRRLITHLVLHTAFGNFWRS